MNQPLGEDQTVERSADPLHGMTLEAILNYLVTTVGWDEMGYRVRVRCFNEDPSISSSLKFLRRTPWARTKVEKLYIETVQSPGSSPGSSPGNDSAPSDCEPDG